MIPTKLFQLQLQRRLIPCLHNFNQIIRIDDRRPIAQNGFKIFGIGSKEIEYLNFFKGHLKC